MPTIDGIYLYREGHMYIRIPRKRRKILGGIPLHKVFLASIQCPILG